MTFWERTQSIEKLTNELLRDMEAELRIIAEKNGEPVYGGIEDAKASNDDLMSWLKDISEEIREQS